MLIILASQNHTHLALQVLTSGLFHPYWLDESIYHLRGVWCIFILFLIEIPVSKQCGLWSDRMWRLIWVNTVCPGPKTGMQGAYGLTCTAQQKELSHEILKGTFVFLPKLELTMCFFFVVVFFFIYKYEQKFLEIQNLPASKSEN